MEEKDFKSFGIRYKIVYLDWHLKKKEMNLQRHLVRKEDISP